MSKAKESVAWIRMIKDNGFLISLIIIMTAILLLAGNNAPAAESFPILQGMPSP